MSAPAEISNLCVYGWYEWIYYHGHGALTENIDKLGRVLDPIKNDGNKMAQLILTSKGTVVTCQTLRKLQESALVCEYEKRKHNLFDDVIDKKLGSFMSYPENTIHEISISYEDDFE